MDNDLDKISMSDFQKEFILLEYSEIRKTQIQMTLNLNFDSRRIFQQMG